jgi:hypothetical protein
MGSFDYTYQTALKCNTTRKSQHFLFKWDVG